MTPPLLTTQVSVRDKMLLDVDSLLSVNMRSGRLRTSEDIAKHILKILTTIVKDKEWKNAKDLLRILRQFGKELVNNHPSETIVGNVVRRVLKIVRDDYIRVHSGHSEQHVKGLLPHAANDYATVYIDLQDQILESIDVFEQEIEESQESITKSAATLLNDGDVVLTMGESRTVKAFLKAAAEVRSISIIVVESAPTYDGHELAKSLGNEVPRASVTVVHDSAVFAIMGRVHKVIIGTHSVLADGGLKAYSGAYAVARAAKHYSVPLIVCAPSYKLTPQFLTSADQIMANELKSPQEIFDFAEGIPECAEIMNPTFDYVPPDLVPLLILNDDGNSPSYVYRLLAELYHPDDYDLDGDDPSD